MSLRSHYATSAAISSQSFFFLNFYFTYYGDKGPNLYTGPWVLFDDVDTSEEE